MLNQDRFVRREGFIHQAADVVGIAERRVQNDVSSIPCLRKFRDRTLTGGIPASRKTTAALPSGAGSASFISKRESRISLAAS